MILRENVVASPKPPLWVMAGVKYRVRHLAFGTFEAECIEPHSGWALFKLLDESHQLLDHGYKTGQAIELSAEFSRVTKL